MSNIIPQAQDIPGEDQEYSNDILPQPGLVRRLSEVFSQLSDSNAIAPENSERQYLNKPKYPSYSEMNDENTTNGDDSEHIDQADDVIEEGQVRRIAELFGTILEEKAKNIRSFKQKAKSIATPEKLKVERWRTFTESKYESTQSRNDEPDSISQHPQTNEEQDETDLHNLSVSEKLSIFERRSSIKETNSRPPCVVRQIRRSKQPEESANVKQEQTSITIYPRQTSTKSRHRSDTSGHVNSQYDVQISSPKYETTEKITSQSESKRYLNKEYQQDHTDDDHLSGYKRYLNANFTSPMTYQRREVTRRDSFVKCENVEEVDNFQRSEMISPEDDTEIAKLETKSEDEMKSETWVVYHTIPVIREEEVEEEIEQPPPLTHYQPTSYEPPYPRQRRRSHSGQNFEYTSAYDLIRQIRQRREGKGEGYRSDESNAQLQSDNWRHLRSSINNHQRNQAKEDSRGIHRNWSFSRDIDDVNSDVASIDAYDSMERSLNVGSGGQSRYFGTKNSQLFNRRNRHSNYENDSTMPDNVYTSNFSRDTTDFDGDENANMFDDCFRISRENPAFSSDSDDMEVLY
nr:protein 51251 [Theama mediterranea]